MLSHAIFTPGQPGWLEAIDRAIAELKPDSFKGYTIGDNTNKDVGKYPWRMDDEKVTYKAYEKFAKAGLVNVCVHKGLFPPSVEQQFPHLLAYSDVRDVGKAAKDWPQLNFIIYHSAYRFAAGGKVEDAWAQFEKTGRIEWVTDLAEIPAKFGVTNVYGDLGQIFAQSTVADPRVCAAMMGQLVKGLGADHVVWGSDAVWTGSPQWQIEALRRLEIPEDMQKKYGFKPLGAADGPGEERDPRRDQRAPVQVRAARRAGDRPPRGDEGGVRAGGTRAQQPALRLRGADAGLSPRVAGNGGPRLVRRQIPLGQEVRQTPPEGRRINFCTLWPPCLRHYPAAMVETRPFLTYPVPWAPLSRGPTPSPPRLLDNVRATVRARHYSRKTEKVYVAWIRRFIVFHRKRHPREMGATEVTQYLSSLATTGHVAASTQNQALSALLFLYRDVLGQDLPWLDDLVRARRPVRLPVVLTRDEVRAIIRQIHGAPRLMAILLYGSGLRLLECARLRVKDVDFARRQITVRAGKGDKDRATTLPTIITAELARHLEAVKKQHDLDVRQGAGWVELPWALARKYPNAGRTLRHRSRLISSKTSATSEPSRSSSATVTSGRP